MALTADTISESLLESIALVLDKKIEAIKFDQTINAIITDVSEADSGKYQVSTGSSTFTAYSTEDKYSLNEAVLVLIPQGNFDNQKMIIGKQVDNLNTPMIYHSPFQTLVDVSNNLIEGNHEISIWANHENDYNWETSLLDFKQSKAYTEKDDQNNTTACIWDSGEIFEQGFSRLGVQAQFSTWLSEYNTILGNYGLALEITFKCVELVENNTFSKIVTFDSNTFFGDVYNFETYYTQEEVFDLTEFLDYPIVRLKLFAYQRNNFVDIYGNKIYESSELDENDFNTINPNIFIKDPYVCLGISIDEFNSDTAILFTENSTTYSKGSAAAGASEIETRNEENQKIIGLRWIHKDSVKNIVKAIQPNEFPAGSEVRWYRYQLGAPSPDQFAGAHWVRFYGCKTEADETGEWALKEEELGEEIFDLATNNLEIYFQPNVNYQSEQIKAIVLQNEGTDNEPVWRRVAVSNILEFINNTDVRSRATIIDQNALAIKFEDDEKGNYFLYNRAGIVGKEEDKEVRGLRAVFDPDESNIYEKAELTEPYTSITWIFPRQDSGTMIIPATSNDLEGVPDYENTVFENVTNVGFFIKPNLVRSATNNTVRLQVIKDGQEYNASVQMLFGTAGTSGSDYTIVLAWEDGQNALNVSRIKETSYIDENNEEQIIEEKYTLAGQVYLLDQSGNVANIQNDKSKFEFSWYQSYEADETQKDLKHPNPGAVYPISGKAHGISTMIYNGLTQDEQNNYKFKLSTNYQISDNNNAIHYNYDVSGSQFIENNNGIYRKIINETDAELTNLLDFKEIDVVSANGSGVLEVTKESQDAPIVTSYGWNENNRVFVKHNGIYIIDPWDSYQEVETYYYPIDTTQRIVENNFLEIIEDKNTTIIGQRFILVSKNNNDASKLINSLYILKVTLKNFGDYDLTACFPIAIKQGDIYSGDGRIFMPAYLEGPTDIRYATSGELDFNKNPYYLKNYILPELGLEKDEIEGHFELFGESFTANGILKDLNDINFSPQLVDSYWYKEIENPEGNPNTAGYYELKNNSDNDYILTTDTVIIENKQYFEQKILFTYLSPPMVYFKETPVFGIRYVLDTTVGSNTIGTVLWTQPVYVYQDNYPSTTLNKWNGKDITTDDETGTIVANGFAAGKKERDNTFTGVVLGDWSRTDTDAFVAAQTGVYGFNHGSMSYALKDDGSAFFGKDGRGRIYLNGNKSQIYSANWLQENSQNQNGMLIDIDDGKIEMLGKYISPRPHVLLQTLKSPYFYIDIDNKKLIYIGSDNYYLQSENWNPQFSGVKFDLKNGKLTGYSFEIRAVNPDGYNAEEDTFNSYTWGSNENGYIITTTAVQASQSGISPYVEISSSDPTYPLNISNRFKVSWGGVVNANGGRFDNLQASGANFTTVNINQLIATTGQISSVNSDNMNATNIFAESGHIKNLVVDSILDASGVNNSKGGLYGSTISGGTFNAGVVNASSFAIFKRIVPNINKGDQNQAWTDGTTYDTPVGVLGYTEAGVSGAAPGVGLVNSSGARIVATTSNAGIGTNKEGCYITTNTDGSTTVSASSSEKLTLKNDTGPTIEISSTQIIFSCSAENQIGIYARFA